MTTRMQRWTAIAGLAFVVLVAASIFVLPNVPDSHASAQKDVAFYHAHRTATGVSAHLIVIAIFVGLFFFWHLRDLLTLTPSAKRFATIGFAGALLFAASGGVAAGSFYALNDTVGHTDPTTIQMLNVLQNDFANGVGAAGVAVFLIASSVAILRGATRLPQWVAWLGVVLGIASLVIIGLGLPAIGLWLLVSCITMLVRTETTTVLTSSEPDPAPA